MEPVDVCAEFIKLFGEQSPPVPRNAAEVEAISDMHKVALQKHMPVWYQSVAGKPESLPAAVASRRQKGTLRMEDVKALQKANLCGDAEETILRARQAEVQDLIDRVEKKGKYETPHLSKEQEQRKAELDEARLWSLNNRAGRRF